MAHPPSAVFYQIRSIEFVVNRIQRVRSQAVVVDSRKGDRVSMHDDGGAPAATETAATFASTPHQPDSLRAIGPRAVLGECPIWDPRLGALFWVDIDGRCVHRWDWEADALAVHSLAGRPGCIALTASPGTLLVAVEHSIGLLDWTTGAVHWQLELAIAEPTTRLNDGRVDRSGDLWIGTMHVPASDERYIGSLFHVSADWTATEVLTGVGVANGLAFSGDSRSVYFADTLRLAAWRFELVAPGVLGDRTPFVEFSSVGLPGRPDGACVDAEGCYWIACVHGSAVARITPDGAVDRVVAVPARRPTCVAFGGPALDTLFVTSIGGGGDYPVFDDEADAGRVFALDVGVTGIAEVVFGGDVADMTAHEGIDRPAPLDRGEGR
jgi:sugar lactone lactonase YvrE